METALMKRMRMRPVAPLTARGLRRKLVVICQLKMPRCASRVLPRRLDVMLMGLPRRHARTKCPVMACLPKSRLGSRSGIRQGSQPGRQPAKRLQSRLAHQMEQRAARCLVVSIPPS